MLPVDVVCFYHSGSILQEAQLEFEYGAVGFGHDPAVEPEHARGNGDTGCEIWNQEPVEGDAAGLKRGELQALGQMPGQVHARQKKRQRRRKPGDFRDIIGIIDKKNLTHRSAAIQKIINEFDIMQDNEKHDQCRDKSCKTAQKPENNMTVESVHGYFAGAGWILRTCAVPC